MSPWALLLEAHETLVVGLDSIAQPDAAYAARADLRATEAQFVRDALGTLGGEIQSVIKDLLLDLAGHAVGVPISRSTAFLNEGRDPAYLEGTAHFVERVAVIAHEFAGPRPRCRALRPIAAGTASSWYSERA